jgi:hypothetical protein
MIGPRLEAAGEKRADLVEESEGESQAWREGPVAWRGDLFPLRFALAQPMLNSWGIMRIVPIVNPAPALLRSAALEVQPRPPTEEDFDQSALKGASFFRGNGFLLFAGFFIGIIALSIVSRYVHFRHVSAPITPIAPIAAVAPAATPEVAPPPVPKPAAVPTITVTPDILRVSSLAMGTPPLAVVNGKQLSEGDSLEVQTPAGKATLRLISIADGAVKFQYQGQTIVAGIKDFIPARVDP